MHPFHRCLAQLFLLWYPQVPLITGLALNCNRPTLELFNLLLVLSLQLSAGTPLLKKKLWLVCEKWHVYLWGRKFTLIPVHKAKAILLCEKGSGRTPLRIARWTVDLLNYTFTVQYRKGEQNKVADALSRNPLDTPEPSLAFEEVVTQVDAMISKTEVQKATACNPLLTQVMEYHTMNSWPPKNQLPRELHQ